MARKINIAVTGTGSLIGQAIIKSILRSDLNGKVNIIGFDYFQNTVASFWLNENYILPDILKSHVDEQEWLNVVLEIIKENAIKMLFIGIDFELPLFAKYKRIIENETSVIIMVSSAKVIEVADDKYLTYEFLKKSRLSYPESFLPNEVDVDILNYPIIVKPRKGARSVGVIKVNDKIQLLDVLKNANQVIIQECIGKDEEEFTCGTIFLDEQLKKVIVLKRSLKEGNTFISNYKKDFPKIIAEYLKDVVNQLRPFGACNFQLRIDAKGMPKIFEINSRHSGTTYIRSLFGFREVEYIINFLLFNKEIEFEMKEGTVVRYYDEFFVRT
ncbi:ATP-grasp domain-containing protein [Leptospira alexanderi]|uniref:ATP-grasp domain protein n=1 Tax=Leptospira alexanderi serovar Manhao 3 str. L 60 TaxID=1049759 RepID=V6HV19_9LEPT|nr:ATP-grasp domain-containing protein [Leptospira alexanderi]EQA61176.1 ATP-grasp domain protein [Leptospira alexanderi serovar Manhao 3 str. L 60]